MISRRAEALSEGFWCFKTMLQKVAWLYSLVFIGFCPQGATKLRSNTTWKASKTHQIMYRSFSTLWYDLNLGLKLFLNRFLLALRLKYLEKLKNRSKDSQTARAPYGTLAPSTACENWSTDSWASQCDFRHKSITNQSKNNFRPRLKSHGSVFEADLKMDDSLLMFWFICDLLLY